MAELIDTPLGPMIGSPADDLVEAAWEGEPAERARLARQALALDPDCLDAHSLLAAIAASEGDRIAHLRAASEIGERLWSPLFDEPLMDWGAMAGPRVWLRALLDLADLSADPKPARRVLALDPGDRLGARAVVEALTR